MKINKLREEALICRVCGGHLRYYRSTTGRLHAHHSDVKAPIILPNTKRSIERERKLVEGVCKAYADISL